MICHHCLRLVLGASMSRRCLVRKIHGVGIQKGSEAKGRSVWLKTFNVCVWGGGFKLKPQLEDPALKNK